MAQFMAQDKRLLAAFIHACWLRRCSPDIHAHLMHDVADSDLEVDSEDILQVELAEILPD